MRGEWLTSQWLRDHRRYAAVAIVVAAAVVTPPSILIQLTVIAPAYAAFEVLIAGLAIVEDWRQ